MVVVADRLQNGWRSSSCKTGVVLWGWVSGVMLRYWVCGGGCSFVRQSPLECAGSSGHT